MIELTFREGVRLRRALRDAFPSRSALVQVVFDHLHEDLGALAADADYGELLIGLIVRTEVAARTGDLIRAARSSNPGDVPLLEFEADYQARRHDAGDGSGLPPRVLSPQLRLRLVNAVLLIPGTDTPDGRTAYLAGLPAPPSRIPGNARADLDTIFTQLDGLGRLASGQWPLLLVIDNILSYVQGYVDISNVIGDVKQCLEEAYRAG
jgi:hypothetical protein